MHSHTDSALVYTHLLSIFRSFSLSLSPALYVDDDDEGVCNARVQVHNTQPYILLSRSYSPSTLSPLLGSSPRSFLGSPTLSPRPPGIIPAPFRGPPHRRVAAAAAVAASTT